MNNSEKRRVRMVKRLNGNDPSNCQFPLTQLEERFLNFKEAQGLAENTLHGYHYTFKRFNEYLTNDSTDIQSLTDDLLRFFKQFRDKSPVYYNQRFKTLNCFFNWAVQQEYMPENPLSKAGLKKRKEAGKVKHHTPEVIGELLNACDLAQYAGLRDYALILLTLDCGIRPSEAYCLKIKDVDFDRGYLIIRPEVAKTRTGRLLPLSSQVLTVLGKLIENQVPEFPDYLFVTADGNQLSRSTWYHRLSYLCKKANLPNVRPYDLRHTFSVIFVKNGGNVFALQKILGHADLSMSREYVKLADSDVAEQHKYASPANLFIKRTTRVRKLK